jgi:hypothetical protein
LTPPDSRELSQDFFGLAQRLTLVNWNYIFQARGRTVHREPRSGAIR